ncbi:DNA polymerase alpha subunit A [Nematocida sp. LUAm3]|nr:DNA polymerase alpha subunit A [Nematocida sp. LUAm3]KAI5173508.1 DNA polymerase alpha subunit A [Nematocida sp. LUAm2]KAI5176729.1 DNA polymerase alpha subunit A [Nematocida sp. LUAm1]
MEAWIVNISRNERYGVSLLCIEKETKKRRVIRVPVVYNEVLFSPRDKESKNIVEKEVREWLLSMDLLFCEKQAYWQEKHIYSTEGPSKKKEYFISPLPFHLSDQVLPIKSIHSLYRMYSAQIEAFIIQKRIRGSTYVRIDEIDKDTCKMEDIHTLGYSTPDLTYAYIFSSKKQYQDMYAVYVPPNIPIPRNMPHTPPCNISQDAVHDAIVHDAISGEAEDNTVSDMGDMQIFSFRSNITSSEKVKKTEDEKDTVNELLKYIEKKQCDGVIIYGADKKIFTENTSIWSKHLIICEIAKYIESVNRLPDYSFSELVEGYGVTTPNEILGVSKEHDKEIFHYFTSAHQMHQIFLKGELFKLAENLSSVTGAPINTVYQGSKADRVEYLLLHKMQEKQYLLPKKMQQSKKTKDTYAGGYVFLENTGIFDKEYVALFDFNSLYPSIIQEYNVCFSTANELSMHKIPEYQNMILPETVRELVEKRKEIKNKIKESSKNEAILLEIEQKAVKLVANCIYGCLGFQGFRFYNKKMASFITEAGRTILKETKSHLEKKGYKPIYGDTDSVMLQCSIPLTDSPPSQEFLLSISQSISSNYQYITLGFEKLFKRIIILAKKKYFGVYLINNEEKIEEKGLETTRRDWAQIVKTTMSSILKILLFSEEKEKEIISQLENLKENFYKGNIKKDQFIIRKKVSKPLKEYTKTQIDSLSHLSLLHRLEKEKKTQIFVPGEIIPYIISTQNGQPSPDLPNSPNPIDINYYLSTQIFPPLKRVLEYFPNIPTNNIAAILNLPLKHNITHYPIHNPGLAHNPNPVTQPVPITITTPCCNTQQKISKICYKCTKNLPLFFLKKTIRLFLYSTLQKIYSSSRECSSCSSYYSLPLDSCLRCNIPFKPTEHSFNTFYSSLPILLQIFYDTELELPISSFLEAAKCFSIDISSFPINSLNKSIYIQNLIGNINLLDTLLL